MFVVFLDAVTNTGEKQLTEGGGSFSTPFEGTARSPWQQDQEATGLTASTLRKQREMKTLCVIIRTRTRGWCHPHPKVPHHTFPGTPA